MAKRDAVRKTLPDAIDQNEAILRGLRSRNKVDNKSVDDLNKLFNTLNTKVATIVEKNKANSTLLSHSVKNLRYGPIASCPVGSWWGIRMDCARSLVHCSFVEDVHDGLFGAASICVSYSNTSVDADHGDLLTFTGREVDEEATNSRESLILNYRYRIPLRVIRSYSLTNKYSPRAGVRYDGLYSVVTHWIGIGRDSKKRHKFALRRITNQDPPPWETNVLVRPNMEQTAPPISKALTNGTTTSGNNNRSATKRTNSEQISRTDSQAMYKKRLRNAINGDSLKKSTTSSVTPSSHVHALAQNNFRLKLCHAQTPPDMNVSIRKDLYSSDKTKPSVTSKMAHPVVNLIKLPSEPVKNGFVQHNNQNVVVNHSTKSNESIVSEKVPTIIDERTKSQQVDKSASNNPVNLSPDMLLDLIMQKKNHPMAQLLIQNMIGVQETNITKAYESLNKSESQQLSKPRSKLNKLKKLIDNRRVLRSYSSSMQTKQLRDRTIKLNDMSTKNKDTRKYPRRQLSNAPSSGGKQITTVHRNLRNNKDNRHILFKRLKTINKVDRELRVTVEKSDLQKDKKSKRMVDVGTQCVLLPRPMVDCCSQTDTSEVISTCQPARVEEVKSESDEESESEEESEDNSEEEEMEEEEQEEEGEYEPTEQYFALHRAQPAPSEEDYVPSAFVPVLKIGNGLRIQRLRSIGFRPIMETVATRKDVAEDYNKYITEENNVVGYMDEELHYQDIEDEDRCERIKFGGKRAQFHKHRSIKPVQSTSKADLFEHDIRWDRKLVWTGW